MGDLIAGFREGRPRQGPVFRVIEDDALQYAADVLVLKYAQALYGVDKAVVTRLGLRGALLPKPGDHLLVPNPQGIVAHNLLFLGVDSLRGFGYRQIREFGRRALQLLFHELPDAGEVCLTLHGAGYGLDEVEAFEAEVAGVVDAITSGAASRSLRFVTFIERNPKRAARMQQMLRSLLPDAGERRESISHADTQAAADRLRAVGYDSQSRPYVFVAMPFAEDLTDYFHYGIAHRTCNTLKGSSL